MYIFVCVCVLIPWCACFCTVACMWKSEENLRESVLSFYPVGPWNQTAHLAWGQTFY